MALAAPSFTVQYCLDIEDANFGKFVIQDTTDYAGEGIDPNDVIGWFVINYPDGTYYQGSSSSPDIHPGASTTWNTLGIPKDSNLDFLEGTYSFSYYIIVAGAVQSGDYQNTGNTFDFCPCNKPSSTVAPLYGGTPSIEVLTNCFCRQIEVNELTNLCVPTTTSRVLTVYPPPSLGLSPYAVNAASLTYNFQYTGSYQVLSNIATTYVTGIFTVKERVKGSVFELVVCDYDLCGLISCLNTYRTETLTKAGQYGGFFNLPKTDLDLWMRINGAIVAFDKNLQCSNWTEANAAYDELKTLLKCDCTCQEDETPRLVNPYCTGSGSNNSITVVSAGAEITVSAAVVGSTTTYTVAVQQALIDSVADNTTNISNLTTIVNNIIAGSVGNNYRLLENVIVPVSTDASVLEKTLMQYDLLGGTLANNGDKVKITTVVATLFDAVQKTIRLYFGGYMFEYVKVGSGYPAKFIIETVIDRKTNTTQNATTKIYASGVPAFILFEEMNITETLSSTVIIKITGENSTATASQITARSLSVEYFKKA